MGKERHRSKRLYLARHAKSSWKAEQLSDFERPLNDRGHRDAPFMGRLLKKLGVELDLVISSPAARAMTTARFIVEEMGLPLSLITSNEILYLHEMEEILGLIRNLPEQKSGVLLVSHNPEISVLASYLAGEEMEDLPTGAVIGFELNVPTWKETAYGTTAVVFSEHPRKYFGGEE